MDTEPRELHEILPRLLEEINAEEISRNSQTLQIDAVFRIPVFGYRDDVSIVIESKSDEESVLHISCRSRTGCGDLGVNRRRVKSILKNLNDHL